MEAAKIEALGELRLVQQPDELTVDGGNIHPERRTNQRKTSAHAIVSAAALNRVSW